MGGLCSCSSAAAPGDDAERPEEPRSPDFDGKAEANQVSGSPVPGSTQSPQDTAKRKFRSQHDNLMQETAAATPGGRTLQSFVPDTLLTWLAEKAAARVPSASFCPAKEHLSAAVAFVDIRHAVIPSFCF